MRKALGSAVNGAVVGAVGNAVEQKISTGRVDVRESITSGLTNAVSGAIYGNAPLKSFKSAFFRGSAAGGATAAINNISNAIGSMYTDDEESFGYSDGISANGATSNGRRRNPRTLCGGINPFEKSLGYQTAYGYQYSAGHSSSSTRTTRKKKGFSLGEFAKDVAVGTMTGGLASVAFHGLGKAVEALTGSVGRSTNASKSSKETVNQIQDPYALMRERGIPQTLTDVEIDAANQFNLQMRANEGSNSSNKIYYHVTTAEHAQQIISTGELGRRNNSWESRVFAWTKQPTRRQASIAGIGKEAQTVIKFNTNASFEPDVGNATKSIANIVVQTTDGQRVPISITNAEKVGFKKEWWQFWKK